MNEFYLFGSPMQLFTLADHRRVAAGEFAVTFRLWKTPHVKKGAVYPTGFDGGYRIDDVTFVEVKDVTDEDAFSAGSPSRDALLKLVAAHTRAKLTPRTRLTRVAFTYLRDAPKKPALAVDEVVARLRRLDAKAPWTRTALALIERQPRTLARILAEEAGFETQPFKINVRKLKALGLTISHERGYELTGLGQAVLDRLRVDDDAE